MKKSIILFSLTLLIMFVAITFVTKESNAILANNGLSTYYEKCNISDDDLESFNLYNVYFKNLNNNYTYGLYERGYALNSSSFTQNSINYGVWYVAIPSSRFVDSRSEFVNLYINCLGSDYDDLTSGYNNSRIENFIYPFFFGSVYNNLSLIDLYNSSFNGFNLNSNFVYFDTSMINTWRVSDSFLYSVDPNLSNVNYFYIGAFVRLYDDMDLGSMGTEISYSLVSKIELSNDTQDSYSNGYDLGFEDGQRYALQNVNTESYNLGREIGYNDGYLAGINANASGDNWFSLALISLFDIPFVVFGRIWDFNILGFNFTTLFFSLLSVGLFIWILKKFISK